MLARPSREDAALTLYSASSEKALDLEQQPPASAGMYEAMFRLNPMPMWVYDLHTLKFLEVNEAALKRYGYTRDEFLSLDLMGIRPPEEQTLLTAYFDTSPEEKAQQEERSWIHLTRSGELLEVQVESQEVEFRGRLARLVVIQDVTEKNRIQKALEESQSQFKLIAENTVNLIIRFDQAFQATYVSPSIQTLLGYTPQEFMEIADYQYIHPEDRDRVIQEVLQAVQERSHQKILEYRLQHKSGFYLWGETAFRLMWQGDFQGFVSSSLNITDRVEARQELMESLTTLSQMVRLAEELEQASEPLDVIHLALQHCTSVLPFDYGMFVQVEDHQYQVGTCLNLQPALAENLLSHYLSHSGPRLLHAFLKGTPAFFDAHEPLCAPPEPLPRAQACQVALLPIRADGRLRGFLVLGTFEDRLAFTENNQRILRAVRDRISHAFERSSYIEKLSFSREETLKSIGMVLEYRDYETKGHTDRVVHLTQLLGRKMGLLGEALDALRWGAYLHDTGKIAIPDHILLKPGKLTREEFEQVKRHSEIGHEMLKNIPSLPPSTLDVILHHHEKWDGSGYPGKMAGYSIPLVARIFSVVDVYDALVSRRPYKEPFSHEAALQEIQSCSGSMFDPHVVRAFVELMQEIASEHPAS